MNKTQIPSDCGNYPQNFNLFNKGDVVKRANGIRNMTVSHYTEAGKVNCVWFQDCKVSRKTFKESNLQLVKA